ncbi:MAG: tRNA lysidine(34) synthetase TilS [Candidatus Aminicenantia bacterium]
MLLKKFKKTIDKYNLIQEGDRILIAFSGGPDSTALVSLFLEYRKEIPLELHLAHFNHKLRKEADEDENHIRNFAEKYSLPLIVSSQRVREFAQKKFLNLEEAGRILRYKFLREAAQKIRAHKIALGHTLTDQAETLLMRIIRGAGFTGLGSIYPVKDEIFIRPLIEIEREEIEEYLTVKNLTYCLDKTNLNTHYLRNRVRLELIPFLKNRFSERIISHLGHLTELIREEEAIIEEIAEKESKKVIKTKKETLLLDRELLSNYPLGLQRRILRNFILKLKGNLKGITFQHIQSLLQLKENKEVHLGEELTLRRENNLIFLKSKHRERIVEYCYFIDKNDKIEIKECGLEFKTEVMNQFYLSELRFDDNSHVYLDAAKLNFPLEVRNRKEGDKYQPLGAPGKKKLKEIMRAKRIPLLERSCRPVFLSQDKIVWVLGLPVAEQFKVTSSTKSILLIKKK